MILKQLDCENHSNPFVEYQKYVDASVQTKANILNVLYNANFLYQSTESGKGQWRQRPKENVSDLNPWTALEIRQGSEIEVFINPSAAFPVLP